MFRRASILAVIDAACFGVCAVAGYMVSGLIASLPPAQYASASSVIVEILVFVPALVPSVVLVAGVLFELGTSNKFASSDAVNWLPVTQAEYVTASTLSIAYAYSLVPSIVMGLTLAPAARLGYVGTWAEMVVLSCVSLVYGGAIVEILRAAVNRVSSAVMRRARRGALVLRLAASVLVILAVELIFNFVFLLDLVGRFASALDAVAFLPVVWASLAVRASETGDLGRNAAFAAATAAFAGSMLLAAVRVRARYWSPTPSGVVVSAKGYAPGRGPPAALLRLGLTPREATLVGKDFKGMTRRRELLQYFAVPFVLAIVFVFQLVLSPGTGASGAGEVASQLPVWFVGGLFGLLISSIGFGQEGRSAQLLYSLPVTPEEVLHAKVFSSMALALAATTGVFVVVALVSASAPATVLLENFAVGVAIAAEEVCLGTAFGARYPDFQERPRPRFVDPVGIILMMAVGIAVLFVTALPSIVSEALADLPAVRSLVQPLFFASLAFAVAVTGLSYGWAKRETRRLLVEFSQ